MNEIISAKNVRRSRVLLMAILVLIADAGFELVQSARRTLQRSNVGYQMHDIKRFRGSRHDAATRCKGEDAREEYPSGVFNFRLDVSRADRVAVCVETSEI